MDEPCCWEGTLSNFILVLCNVMGVYLVLAIRRAFKFLWLQNGYEKSQKVRSDWYRVAVQRSSPWESQSQFFPSSQCPYHAASSPVIGTGLTLPIHPCLFACTKRSLYLLRPEQDFCMWLPTRNRLRKKTGLVSFCWIFYPENRISFSPSHSLLSILPCPFVAKETPASITQLFEKASMSQVAI